MLGPLLALLCPYAEYKSPRPPLIVTCPDEFILSEIKYNDCTQPDDVFHIDNIITDPNPPQYDAKVTTLYIDGTLQAKVENGAYVEAWAC
ncbi:hypothetical protein ABVK25_004814 [Lepraria finkii]|uniref:Uncharacterized protein n=1 Tax=Lepraria finkii TaxID=1340010 RepID=A0ABR4BC41_9LECA